MATLYEIISFADMEQTDEAKVRNILEKSGKYHIYQKGILGTTTVDGDAKEIAEYVKAIDRYGSEEKYEKVKALEKERQEEIQKLREQDTSIRAEELSENVGTLREKIYDLKASLPAGTQYYEYKTIVIKDSEFIGSVDVEKIELTLCKFALEGWRLKAAITNEAGHNRAVVVNATINNTVLIFERLVTKE